jgi:hypothetical protein
VTGAAQALGRAQLHRSQTEHAITKLPAQDLDRATR